MKIKFFVKYSFKPYFNEHERYNAVLSAWLPVTPDSSIEPSFQADNSKLAVTHWSGIPDESGKWRVVSFNFSASSYEELNEEVTSAVASYKAAVEEAVDKIVKMKGLSREFAEDFPDPVSVD